VFVIPYLIYIFVEVIYIIMKRKLIDLKESTFDSLNTEAIVSGTNLKRYIEDLLDEKAKCLEDMAVCEYRFVSGYEPSDEQLSVIMDCAAESVVKKKKKAITEFFSELAKSVSSVD